MIFLSNIIPDAGSYESVGWLVVTIGAAALIIDRVMSIVRSFRRQPPIETTFVNRTECGLYHKSTDNRVQALEARMDRVERKMESDKQEILRAGDERMDRIENRIVSVEDKLRTDIKEVLRAVSRLEGKP